ncbi:Zn-dependent hydrolase, partial [Citrobacter sp. AAK_AS5]
WETVHQTPAVICSRRLTLPLENAAKRHQREVPLLTSGAGHDAAALAAICPVAMLFVRCKGGQRARVPRVSAPASSTAPTRAAGT